MTDHWTGRIGMGTGERAAFAARPEGSRARFFAEPPSLTRTAFQRDRDRIVHSTAFRRLKHKTQVFIAYEGDHYRTRLTHTIEVSQIARALARAFRLDEDLTEAIALAHDFGHTPFGHAGERALDRCMAPFGGFDHNAQTLRIVVALEQRYAEFDGLNLAWDTLEGLVKHNGPLVGPHASDIATVPRPILDFDTLFPLDLDRHSSLEAQVAAIADDIAYNTHDLDDGLRAALFDIADLGELGLAGDILREVRTAYPNLERSRLIHEIMRRHITRMVEDVIQSTLSNLEALRPTTVEDVRNAGRTLVTFSPAMQAAEAETKRFLFARVYRNPSIMRVMLRAEDIVADLFGRYLTEPQEMGGVSAGTLARLEAPKLARRVADYLSGMTDNYAIGEHRRLFDATPDLR